MKIFLILLFFSSLNFLYSQVEGLNPLTKNPHIEESNLNKKTKKTTTFDSTFIYIYDTLNLPFYDEFCTNKIQKYSQNYTDNDVYFDKKYKLLKSDNVTPFSKNDKFSSNPTYRKTYSIDGLTHNDIPLSIIQINIGELNSYPVQYVNSNVYPAYNIIDSLGVLNDKPDTIDLLLNQIDILQDSAIQFFKPINDPNSLWVDNKAYHNFHFGYLPWSLGVMTFDGLDERGRAYEIGTTSADYADYLTSKPLNLSTYSASDSLYLSFLYQCGGYGEEPDSTDSLILEFYNKSLDRWEWIWSINGNSNFKDFKVGHILIQDLKYLKKGFKFRFKNYGQKSGGYDHFNIDFVYLRANSAKQDTLFRDFAWVYPINSLISDYTSVPWDHYKNNYTGKMSSNVNLVIRNNNNIPSNTSANNEIKIKYNGILESTFSISGNMLSNGDLNYQPRTTYSSTHIFTGGYHFDESKQGTKNTFEITGIVSSPFGSNLPNYKQNDTTYSSQKFENYYSYDDGSAEAAYGIIGKQSNLAVQFTPYESDSLIGIQTCFVESATDVSKKLFLLNIWKDNNGVPGELIYEDDLYSPRTPMYEYENNSFHKYYFQNNKKIKVNGPFYIGWRQFDSERLNIGFDKNIINNTKNFYSLDKGVSWINSEVKGSVMIRPIFSTSMDAELGINDKIDVFNEYRIYPNPTNSLLSINGEFESIELYTLEGKILLTSNEKVINLEEFTNGIYLLKINGRNNKTFKIIKN